MYVPGILRSITPIRIRKIAPITIAITDVSPIVPGILPISISIVFTVLPAFNCASGVAPVTPSYTKLVIWLVNESRRKHLAPRAGFIKFCPRPPNNCFTIRIANTLPIAPIHHGAVGGIFSPSNSPVTAALQSLIVIFLCINFSYMYSVNTATTVVVTSIPNAGSPKFHTPNADAGKSAMATSIIILLVVALERICGEDDIFKLFSLTFVHLFFFLVYFFFLRFANAIFLIDPIACFSGRFAGHTKLQEPHSIHSSPSCFVNFSSS